MGADFSREKRENTVEIQISKGLRDDQQENQITL